MDVVETEVGACTSHTLARWTWATGSTPLPHGERMLAHLSRAQVRHLHDSGVCQYPPHPSKPRTSTMKSTGTLPLSVSLILSNCPKAAAYHMARRHLLHFSNHCIHNRSRGLPCRSDSSWDPSPARSHRHTAPRASPRVYSPIAYHHRSP
jgi:hypothetical protein